MAEVNLGRIGFVNKGSWNSSVDYKINDVVKYGGSTYAAKRPNIGIIPPTNGTDTDDWFYFVNNSDYVDKTSNQKVTGVKDFINGIKATEIIGETTFTESPIVPTPTTDTQAANKAYIDSTIVDRIGLINYGYVAKPYHIVAFGGEFNRADYPKLWAYIQGKYFLKSDAEWQDESTTNDGICGFYSTGNGTTTFRVPSLDKAFLRPESRTVGSFQGDEFKSHSHPTAVPGNSGLVSAAGHQYTVYTEKNRNTDLTGGDETRPKNIAVLPLIVAK